MRNRRLTGAARVENSPARRVGFPILFDVRADQANGKVKWGRWRKSGGTVAVDFGNGWPEPPRQSLRMPAKRGLRLEGTYRTASSYSIGTVSAWSFRNMEFRRGGRFRRSNSGGVGGSMGAGDHTTSSILTHDDKGSASASSAPRFGDGTSQSTGKTEADLRGTYLFDGWTLELRFDNGKVERHFTYYDAEGDDVWLGGAELSKSKQ